MQMREASALGMQQLEWRALMPGQHTFSHRGEVEGDVTRGGIRCENAHAFGMSEILREEDTVAGYVVRMHMPSACASTESGIIMSPRINDYDNRMRSGGTFIEGGRIILLVGAAVLLLLFCVPVIADNPSEVAMALSKKADDLIAQDRYQEAIDLYNEAIALDPYSSAIWNRLGMAEMGVGRYPDAAQAFQKSLDLDPYYSLAWRNKGDALHAQEEYQAAIDAYDRALAINSNDLDALLQKGINLQVLGQSTQAMEIYREVIRLAEKEMRRNPNQAKYDATLWTNLGEALTRLGRYEEALQAYETAVQINPKYEKARSGMELVNETLYRARVAPESLDIPLQPATTVTTEAQIPLSPVLVILGLFIPSIALFLAAGRRKKTV